MKVVNILPHVPSSSPIWVFKEPGRESRNMSFEVRPRIALKAPVWLKENNNLYESITIAMNCVEQLSEKSFFGYTKCLNQYR